MFYIGVLTAFCIVAIAITIDPLISAHVYCAMSQSARCF